MNINIKSILSLFAIVLLSVVPSLSLTYADDVDEELEEMFDDSWDFEDDWDDDWEDDWEDDWDDEESDMNWGFSSDDEVVLNDSWYDFVELEIPLVEDGSWNTIQNYEVIYNTESIADSDPMDIMEESFSWLSDWDNLVEISDLEEWTEYYAIVIPLNQNSVEWEYTEEFTFETKEEEQHWAAEDDVLSDVSYSHDNWDIKVTWAAISEADKVEVFLRHDDESDYNRIWDANASYWEFDVMVSNDWDYHVRLIALDDAGDQIGSERVLTMKDIEVEREAEVEEAPEVWPSLSILISLILIAFISYIVYRYRSINS